MAGERRDVWGSLFGILVFLGGVGLIGFTFTLALELFRTPPEIALGLKPGEPLDLNGAVTALGRVLVQTVMIVVMALIGAMVASRGIKMYASGRPVPSPAPPKDAG